MLNQVHVLLFCWPLDHVNKSATLDTYEAGSEEEGTSSRSPISARKSEVKEGVENKLERLKEELLAKLKS